MAIGSPLGGWISDRLVSRFGIRIGRSVLGAVSLTISAVFLVLGTQVQSPQWASLVLAGGAGSLYLSQSCFWSVSGGSAGLVSGVMNMGGQLGGRSLLLSLRSSRIAMVGILRSSWPLACAITWLPVQRKAGGAVAGDSKPASLIKA